jgi:hypothetical protein
MITDTNTQQRLKKLELDNLKIGLDQGTITKECYDRCLREIEDTLPQINKVTISINMV